MKKDCNKTLIRLTRAIYPFVIFFAYVAVIILFPLGGDSATIANGEKLQEELIEEYLIFEHMHREEYNKKYAEIKQNNSNVKDSIVYLMHGVKDLYTNRYGNYDSTVFSGYKITPNYISHTVYTTAQGSCLIRLDLSAINILDEYARNEKIINSFRAKEAKRLQFYWWWSLVLLLLYLPIAFSKRYNISYKLWIFSTYALLHVLILY